MPETETAPPSPPGTALPVRSPRSASTSETLRQMFSLSPWDSHEAASGTDSLFATLADITGTSGGADLMSTPAVLPAALGDDRSVLTGSSPSHVTGAHSQRSAL